VDLLLRRIQRSPVARIAGWFIAVPFALIVGALTLFPDPLDAANDAGARLVENWPLTLVAVFLLGFALFTLWPALRPLVGLQTYHDEERAVRQWLAELEYEVHDRDIDPEPPRRYQFIAIDSTHRFQINVSRLKKGDRVLLGVNLPLEESSQSAFDQLTPDQKAEQVRAWRRDFALLGVHTDALNVPPEGQPMTALMRYYIHADRELNEHTLREGVHTIRRAVITFQNALGTDSVNSFGDTER